MVSHSRLLAIALEAVSLWSARSAFQHAYSSLILFFGASFTKASILHRGGAIVPKVTAVEIRTEILDGLEGRA